MTGLLAWIGYLITSVTGLAWTACGFLLPVAGLGMALVFLAPARSGDDRPPVPYPPPVPRRSAFVVAAHITAALVTILLAVLAAIGTG